MSSGLYRSEKIDLTEKLDLTRVKPYGDTLNDGKVQISFTLPVPDGDRAVGLLTRWLPTIRRLIRNSLFLWFMEVCSTA